MEGEREGIEQYWVPGKGGLASGLSSRGYAEEGMARSNTAQHVPRTVGDAFEMLATLGGRHRLTQSGAGGRDPPGSCVLSLTAPLDC